MPSSGAVVDHAAAVDRTALDDLVRDATAADGVGPLSEHARLHAARGDGTDLVVRVESIGVAGALAGFAHLDPGTGGEPASAELVVHPDARRQGIGRALAEALVEAAGAGGVRVWAHGRLPGAVALASRLAAREVRELRLMGRSLDGENDPGPDLTAPVDAGFPDDLRVRAFVVGADEQEWLRVNALAFAHHPEQGGWTLEDLREREGSDWFDPEGFLVAEVRAEPGRMAGYHWTKQHIRDGTTPLGEVYVVGLDPAYQGRGLGSLLTLAGLRHLRSRGLDEVILYVDGDNAAAVATYERLGFHTRSVDVMYAAPGPADRLT